MTEKLYYENQYIKTFDAEVLSCEKADENYEIILDKSAFYPEGGGQPGDRGYIGKSKVLNTLEKDGNQIHICDLPAQGKCECSIDWKFRFSNMQQHTGEHIFSGIAHKKTGCDNVGFHMGKDEVTVDFNVHIDAEKILDIEKEANEAVWNNIPVEIIYPAQNEIEKYDYRSKKEIKEKLRLVKIGDADLCACCGTHTAFTGEVGMIKAVSCVNYKQGVRMTLKIGDKAFDDYAMKNASNQQISNLLCAKAGETAQAVEKLKEKAEDANYRLTGLKLKFFDYITECLDDGKPFAVYDSGEADDARLLADILSKKRDIAFAFSGNDADGYKYAIVSAKTDVREDGKKINASLDGRGGGKPEMVMGSVKCTLADIEKYFGENKE